MNLAKFPLKVGSITSFLLICIRYVQVLFYKLVRGINLRIEKKINPKLLRMLIHSSQNSFFKLRFFGIQKTLLLEYSLWKYI